MATKKTNPGAILARSEMDWRIEDDMRTLARAAEIRADPKRLKAAQDMAAKKMLELASVASKADPD